MDTPEVRVSGALARDMALRAEAEAEEFYNQCNSAEDGRFCEGADGPGRVRDEGTEDLGKKGLVTKPKSGGRRKIGGGTQAPGSGGRRKIGGGTQAPVGSEDRRKIREEAGLDGDGPVDHGKVAKVVAGYIGGENRKAAADIYDKAGDVVESKVKEAKGFISSFLKKIGIDRTDDRESITEKVIGIFGEDHGPSTKGHEAVEREEKISEKEQKRSAIEAKYNDKRARNAAKRAEIAKKKADLKKKWYGGE